MLKWKNKLLGRPSAEEEAQRTYEYNINSRKAHLTRHPALRDFIHARTLAAIDWAILELQDGELPFATWLKTTRLQVEARVHGSPDQLTAWQTYQRAGRAVAQPEEPGPSSWQTTAPRSTPRRRSPAASMNDSQLVYQPPAVYMNESQLAHQEPAAITNDTSLPGMSYHAYPSQEDPDFAFQPVDISEYADPCMEEGSLLGYDTVPGHGQQSAEGFEARDVPDHFSDTVNNFWNVYYDIATDQGIHDRDRWVVNQIINQRDVLTEEDISALEEFRSYWYPMQ